eukprot:190802_1
MIMYHLIPYVWLLIIFSLNIELILSEIYYNRSWTLGSPPDIPYDSHYMAVGYDVTNNEIVMAGYVTGKPWNEAIIYNIDNNEFNITTTSSIIDIQLYGQGYTQLNDILYILQTATIYELTMDTKQRTTVTSKPYNSAAGTPCLTHFNDNYLILGGGLWYDPLKNVEIYSISEDKWLDGVPSMNTGRGYHSCIVYGHYLYQFGGDGVNGNELIEKLYIDNETINDLTGSEWEYINNTLPENIGIGSRAIIYDDKIFIFYGKKYLSILDPMTDEITTVTPFAYNGAKGAMVIAVDETIYLFGGVIGSSGGTDQWQYIDYSITTTPTPTTTTTSTTSSTTTTTTSTTSTTTTTTTTSSTKSSGT